MFRVEPTDFGLEWVLNRASCASSVKTEQPAIPSPCHCFHPSPIRIASVAPVRVPGRAQLGINQPELPVPETEAAASRQETADGRNVRE